jgi:DNA-binding protein Fis
MMPSAASRARRLGPEEIDDRRPQTKAAAGCSFAWQLTDVNVEGRAGRALIAVMQASEGRFHRGQASDHRRDPAPQSARRIADTVPALVAELTASASGRLYLDTLRLIERPLLEHVLWQTGGNQLRAARLLGINRNTLRSRLRALGLKARG